MRRRRFFIFLLLIVALGISSCRTTRNLADASIKPLSTRKLVNRVEQNAFDYDFLTIRRINCRFSSNQNNTNFRVNLKAIKDEKILVSISKINIPVGRVLLTPDSVKYVNYIDRNFFVDDYSYLSSFLNTKLDFETIQSIISNNAFSYHDYERRTNFMHFNSSVEEGMFLLESGEKQKMYFSPLNYALTKLIVNDETNGRKLEMVFDDFEKVKKKDYPGTIEMTMISSEDIINMKLRMNGFSTDKIDKLTLRIPDKYEQIRVN
ncbi:MAG: DUF4292 domain-containing protein [Bacteroidota bacterium]